MLGSLLLLLLLDPFSRARLGQQVYFVGGCSSGPHTVSCADTEGADVIEVLMG